MDTREPRPYLVLFNLPEPNPEHARLKDALTRLCHEGEKAHALYVDRGSAAFGVYTSLNAGQICGRLDQIIFDRDRFIIVELSGDWMTYGYGKAANWFQKHLDPVDRSIYRRL